MKLRFSKIILIIYFLFKSWATYSQNFIWAREGAGDGQSHYSNSFDYSVTNDEEGNVYTSGSFVGKMKFDSVTLNSFGICDVFISKYNSKGELIWIIQDGGISNDIPKSICYDRSGNIYVVGEFEATATFGSTTFTESNMIASAFIVKYDTSGNFIWAKEIAADYPTSTTIYFSSINVDDFGNVLLGGSKNGSGTSIFGTIPISDKGGFTAKYDSSGTALWVSMGIENFCQVTSIIADHAGNYYATGSFGSWVIPAPGTQAIFGTVSIYSHAYSDIFLVKYNSNGQTIWAERLSSGWYIDAGRDLGVDSLNNIYLCGVLSDSVGSGKSGFMISKYDSSGNLYWRKTATGGGTIRSISVNRAGDIYFTGALDGSMILNGDTLIANVQSIITGKMDANGNTVWIISNNAQNSCQSGDISTTAQGNSFVTGSFNPCIRFGSEVLMGLEDRPNLFITMLNDTFIIPIHNNLIRGNIYNDTNNNCIKEVGEMDLAGFSVMAQPGNYFAVTDSSGNYSLLVDSGIYSVSQLIPLSHSLNAIEVCPGFNNPYTIIATSSNAVYSGNDFADNTVYCPVLNVDIMIPIDQICCDMEHQLNMIIYNYGLIPSYSTQLSLTFSSAFIPQSSVPGWTSYMPGDTTMLINVGTILPKSSTTLSVTDSVKCYFPDPGSLPYMHFARVSPINSCNLSDTIYCSDTLNENIFSCWWSISEADKFRKMTLSPNPSSGTVTLTGVEHESLLEIFDVNSRIIYRASINMNTKAINLGLESEGVYFYKILNPGGQSESGVLIIHR